MRLAIWLSFAFVLPIAACSQTLQIEPLKKLNAGTKAIQKIAFSNNGKWVAVSTEGKEVRIADIDKNEWVASTPATGEVLLLRFTELDAQLLVAEASGRVYKFSPNTRQISSYGFSGGIRLAAMDPNQQYLACLSKAGDVELFDLKAGMTFGRTKAAAQTSGAIFLGFDRFGQQLAVVTKLGDALTYNLFNQQLVRQLKLQSGEYTGSRSVVHAAATNFSGDQFVIGMQEVFLPTGGMQGRNQPERRNVLISYDWVSGQEYKRIGTRFRADEMAFAPGYVALLSTDTRTISIYDVERGEIGGSVAVDEKPVAITFSDDYTLLAIGTAAGNLYLYDIIRNNPVEIKIVQPNLSRNAGTDIVRDNKTIVAGIVEGTNPIARILVNGEPVSRSKEFRTEVPLIKGKNRIRIEVEHPDRSVTEKDLFVTSEPAAAPVKEVLQKATAGKRYALIIGNAAYTQTAKLNNTVNDAKSMEATLKEMNFEVQTLLNASYEQMKNAVYEFGDRIKEADVSLFFYAGHGLEVDGTNYLVPVDATINSALDVKLKAIPLVGVTRTMEYSNDEGLNMIILDACRNNPFPTGKRSAGAGLARVQAPSGTLIAYATDPGSTASDGDGTNGLYTGELVKQLKVSQRIEDIFMNTRNEVERLSNGSQRPWEEARLKGVFYLR
jgi:WD40 repeat protein